MSLRAKSTGGALKRARRKKDLTPVEVGERTPIDVFGFKKATKEYHDIRK